MNFSRLLSLLLFISLAFNSFSQLNITEVGHLTYSKYLSDIWGYTKTNGDEIAIVTTVNGTSIVDISNPSTPTEIYYKTSAKPDTWWRDAKTWDKYAYVVTEASEGLYILDLEALPGTVNEKYYTGSSFPFTRAHNIAIDENGIAYIFGSNYGVGGVIMLDLATDPFNPIELGVYNGYYVHDGVVRGDTLWASCINNGFQAVIDVSNKANPTMLANWSTPANFAHNCDISNDGNYLYVTEEKENGYITSYDVSNINNAVELDRWRSNPGTNVIPHNAYFINDYIVTSYYNDGVTICDVTHPDYIVQTGYFDTEPDYWGNGNTGNPDDAYWGAWGAYPYFASGNIIVSDGRHGLFVLGPNYTRASFIEGNVTDSCGNVLTNVNVELLVDGTTETNKSNGNYLLGIAGSGTYDVQFTKTGYETVTIPNVTLANGVTLPLNVMMGTTGFVKLNAATQINAANCTQDISVVASDGDGGYTYLWNNSSTTNSIGSVAAGNYSVTVTDGLGCEVINTLTVSALPTLAVSLTSSSTTCGSSDGSVTATVQGGQSPFNYNWNNGQILSTNTGLGVGSYSVTVSDANGCFVIKNNAVSSNSGPVISVDAITTVTCHGGNDGAITVSATGATSSFTFSWSNGNTTIGVSDTQNNLSAGEYTLEVLDDNGCLSIESITIEQAVEISVSFPKQTPTCHGLADGAITASVSNGKSPYTYLWDNLTTTATNTNLIAGEYFVTITDGNRCSLISSTSLTEPTELNLSITKSDLSCGDVVTNDGAIIVTVSGGLSTYNYLWNNNMTSNSISGLAEGIYIVTVSDISTCSKSESVTITTYPTLYLSVSATNATTNLSSDGTAAAIGSGGIGVISYLWSNGATTADISGLIPGDYYIVATDENGCTIENSLNPAVVGYDRLNGINQLQVESVDVFPNPFNTELNIITNISGSYQLQLLDVLGRSLYNETLHSNRLTMEMPTSLPKGLYLVRLVQNGVVVSEQKMLKD